MRSASRIRVPQRHRHGGLTFDDFVAIIPDGQQADLLDGVIYVASPDNTDAGDLNTWLSTVLQSFVDMRDLGKVYAARIAYRLGPHDSPEPDLSFLAKAQLSRRQRGYIDGPPTLAIEIVSPDSVERDYVKKRMLYRKAGVREYWIVDPDAGHVTFLSLRGGKYQRIKPVKHIYKSEAVPGFQIDERWLLTSERPVAYEVLRGLLET